MMKKISMIFAFAALFALSACEKENVTETPEDNTGGGAGTGTEAPSLNIFSVSATKQVRIADGNLQYQASTNTWRIAPHAWDGAKSDNANASASYDGWIDAFGWGTSGYNDKMPYSTIADISGYCTEGDIVGTQYDWGMHNDIKNGSATDPAGSWRMLTTAEWQYLFTARPASTVAGVENARFALATVANQIGMLLFPDQFTLPEGVQEPVAASINDKLEFSHNQYTADDWAKLQEAGCAFLPAVGFRGSGQTMISIDYLGCYWTGTYIGYMDDLYRAGQFLFNQNIIDFNASSGVQYARSVRLAKDIK